MKLTLQSKLSLIDLEIHKDKKHYIVEDKENGEFYEMPKVCIDAIEQINKGRDLTDIENTLKEHYPEEDIDIIPFVQQLTDFGLVKEINGESVTVQKNSTSVKGFEWISSNFSGIFFNKVSNKIYTLLFLTNFGIILFNPALLPNYHDIFLFNSMVANILTYMAVSLVLIIIHEVGHIIAIRSYNLPTKLDIGNRLFLIVFETDLTPAWKLPSRERNTLYLAGMSFEQAVLFVAFILTIVIGDTHPVLIGLLGIVILDVFVKTIYQFSFFMKTDIYFVMENLTGCYNLMESGKAYLRKWIPFIKKASTEKIFDNDIPAVRLYSVFYCLGTLLTICIFVFYFVPQVVEVYFHIIKYVIKPSSPYFWDSIMLLGIFMLMFGLLLYAKTKSKRDSS